MGGRKKSHGIIGENRQAALFPFLPYNLIQHSPLTDIHLFTFPFHPTPPSFAHFPSSSCTLTHIFRLISFIACVMMTCCVFSPSPLPESSGSTICTHTWEHKVVKLFMLTYTLWYPSHYLCTRGDRNKGDVRKRRSHTRGILSFFFFHPCVWEGFKLS
jgi:hypothetical protein